MSTIVVSSNCQTGGVAASLGCFLPSDTIVPVPLPRLDEPQALAAFRDDHLKDADVWIAANRPAIIHAILPPQTAPPSLRVIPIPVIYFSAFHPDLVYVTSARTGRLTSIHYNSAIVAWCYKHGIQAERTASLFSRDVYEALGYFDRWQTSVDELRGRFESTSLDFASFFLPVKREPVFMHSVNHPTARCLTGLARLAAQALGVDRRAVLETPSVRDGLAEFAWPVYPEIAETYGIEGEYAWTLPGGRLTGTRRFVDAMFERYRKEGFEPTDITISEGESALDAVLPPILEGRQ